MHQSGIPDGIDENNACRVVIDVVSFSTVEDGRSVYKKGRSVEWWVDSEEYSIIDMEKDVGRHYSWDENQEANFWFVCPQKGLTVRLGTDQELLDMLRASKLVKFIMTVDRCAHAIVSEMVPNEENELQIQIANEENELQNHIANEENVLQVPVPIQVEFEDQEWAEEPEHGSLRQFKLEDYVHDYYSLRRFKAAYQFEINPMVDKSQWRVADPGFQMLPPKLERATGRPRVKRIKSRGEPGKRGPYQCKRCFQFGHIEKGCSEPPTELSAELPPPLPPKSRKRKGEAGTSKSKKVAKKSKDAAATTSNSLVTQAQVSPGVTTRRMSSSTPTRPPNTPISPEPTTRRMAAQLDISPGGIARRLIIS